MSEQPARYQRTTGGLVGALIVAVAVVVGFVLLRDLVRTEAETEVKEVDYLRVLEFTREQVDFDPLAPRSLPDGWRATSARITPQPARWHLGVLTDQDRYIGLEQSRSSEANMVRRYVDAEAVEGEPVTIDGRAWRTWTDQGGDNGLSRVVDGVTVVVVGTPDQALLADYVESLR